jgi:hypothetical protein
MLELVPRGAEILQRRGEEGGYERDGVRRGEGEEVGVTTAC